MSGRFSTARHCHAVLSILLSDLHSQFDDDSQARRPATTNESLQKRRRLDTPSSTMSNQPKSPSTAHAQADDTASEPRADHQPGSMMAPSKQPQFTQPNYEYPRQGQSSMPWPDPMMSGDVGDVFGQVSWEALFQGDGTGWEEWENFSSV